PKAVVHVLYNGTDTGRFNRHEKTPGDTFRFLYAGRIIKGKGVKELTEAFCKLTDKNDTRGSRSYALDIAGFSDREYSYEAEIKKLAAGKKDSIRCIEKVPHEQMQELYDTADVVVMPSMVEESFGLVALEAMAMGMPLIVSDSGALPEVVGDSALIAKREGDYISNLAKAMENLAGSADLTKDLGKRAFERARSNPSFDIKNYYKGFLDIISVNVDPKEKISVVMPVYNVEKYLERCIDSVTGQSYKNLEIIVVDDGSTDGSGELCDRLAVDDDRIKVIHQRNMGLSGARNTGLDVMSGDYVFFCDSDDVIAPETLEKLIFMIKRDRADVTACGFSHVYDEYFETGQGEKTFTSDKPGRWNGHDSVSEMMRNNSICTVACNKLFKRELFDDIRFPLGVLNEDEATIYKVLYKASIVSFTPKLFYKYYQRSTGIMHGGVEGRYKDLLKAFSDRYEFFKENNEPVLMQHSLITLLDGMKYVYRTVEDKNIKDEVVRKYKETVNIGNAPSLMGGKKKVALLLWKYIRY
ncbi:MAG: glycosyltransferase, partial [Butyrivibrio sp.]|nr:glycosyltransferase [Butyrivibrio sp.]